jgi:Dolichyl-phosphate-mannose-protein mannosyltransferase/Tetratricopeptide repeat
MSSARFHWQKFFFPAVVLLFLIYGLEMFLSARLESQTFDEPAHLYAGYSYWLRSDFGINPEHPPLVKLVAALPLILDKPAYPEPTNRFFRADSGDGGWALMHSPGSSALLDHARLAVSVFAFLMAGLVLLAGLEMFGRGAALFALTLFVFDPLLIGHGPLITTDMGVSCAMFATVYAFYRYVKQPSLLRLGVCGVLVGLALATKHSAILIAPILILLAAIEVARRWSHAASSPDAASEQTHPQPEQGRVRSALRMAASLVAICTVSVAVLWAFYGFRYQARPGGVQITPPTDAYLHALHQPVEAKMIGFAEQHHLLPEAYLYGLTDVTILSNDGRMMFLFGKMYPEGRWFYFPAAFLIKSTIGFLAILLLVPFSRDLWRSELRRELLFLVVPAAVYFGIAMTSKLDIGVRHVMPVLPFLIVLAAGAAVSLARRSRVWAWAVCILLGLHVASSLRAFPNYMEYSNEFFGGPDKTHRVLADSNVGWGGGLKELHAYIAREHITQCWLAYYAFPDPADFQISCRPLPTFFSMFSGSDQQPVPEQIEGPVFVSSEEVEGIMWGPDQLSPYQVFLGRQPAHIIGAEILEFDGAVPINRIAGISHLMVANGLIRQGKVDDALAHAEQAVALYPESLDAHQALANAYAAHHQPDDAAREYQTMLHLYDTVHPEFKNAETTPVNPLASSRH